MTEYLTISLNKDLNINNDISSVCVDITNHYKSLIPNGPPLGYKPLYVNYNPLMTITFVDGLPIYYSMGITVKDRLYNQIAYQFSHELTHIYCDARITNWFIESLCEMASLYFLEYLAEKWAASPPLVYYASKFSEYGNNRINEVKAYFGIEDAAQLDSQFYNIISTITEPYDRNSNTVVAIKLLSLFRGDNNFWKILPIIGQCTDKALSDGSFYDNSVPDFDKLVSNRTGEVLERAEEIRKLFKNKP